MSTSTFAPAAEAKPRVWVWQSRVASWRLPVRSVWVGGALLGAALVAMLVSLSFGDYPLSVSDVAAALFGAGDDFSTMVVVEWRVPIALAALVFGALLGVGGAIFQSITRNPLGSPDVIGFDAGAYTAVVICMLLIGRGDSLSLAAAALCGGLATALIVYALSYRGGIQGFRFIIVGIAISAMLGSINAYLLTRADVTDAMSVGFWGAGSLSRITWVSLVPVLAVAAPIIVLAIALTPQLRRLELGDDAAITQGARVNRERALLLVVGVTTTALVTAAAGPIGFVALAAPQLARRLARSAGVSVLLAALMGAMLLACAHVLALVLGQVLRPIPVGLVTVCLGGLYFIWILMRESKRQNGR